MSEVPPSVRSMNVTRLAPRSESLVIERRGVRCLQVNDALWRLTRTDGRVIGYLESLEPDPPAEGPRAVLPDGAVEPRRSPDRFALKRLRADRRGFVELGRFRDLDEALDALRYASAS